MRTLVLFTLFCATAAPPLAAQDAQRAVGADAQHELMVTVYNNNYGLVREVRTLELPVGIVELEFQDVAEQIDPTSVAFKSLTAPDQLSILEQNYRYDLLSPQTLLDKHVGKEISYTTQRLANNSQLSETRTGVLLSTNGGNVVRFGEDIVINPLGSVSFGQAPEDLLSRPTLLWLLSNQAAGEQRVETSYLTNGMNWKADYVTILDAEDAALDLTGWVTLTNNSGTTFREATLKLVAGDVQRIQPRRRDVLRMATAQAGVPEAAFAEKSFFEYHLYTLGRKTTLANKETKQITLLEGSDVPVRKLYIMESPPWAPQAGMQGVQKSKFSVLVEFANNEASGLGMALPAGRVRAYKADTDGSLQLVGESQIDHTPKDETLRLKLGNAFDIIAERSQTQFRKLSQRSSESSFKVVIRNHKATAITATVMEHVYGDWVMVDESHLHVQRDARTIEYNIPVPANGEAELTYTVRVNY